MKKEDEDVDVDDDTFLFLFFTHSNRINDLKVETVKGEKFKEVFYL